MAALGLIRNKGEGLCPEGSSSARWALGGQTGQTQDPLGATVDSLVYQMDVIPSEKVVLKIMLRRDHQRMIM